MFSKNIRTLYLYVVSFLSLMAMIYGTVSLVEKITNYIYPVAYMSSSYSSYDDINYTTKDVYNTTISKQQEESNIQRETLKDIFTSIAVILVSVSLYSYHWTMVQKEEKREEV
jgi:hypothetical protein